VRKGKAIFDYKHLERCGDNILEDNSNFFWVKEGALDPEPACYGPFFCCESSLVIQI
jgi:hypothetical protein